MHKTYDVELCVGRAAQVDYMHLRIYEKNGRLVAGRNFVFDRDSSLDYVRYYDDRIEYSDIEFDHESIVVPKDKVLPMPPTWWDWLSANLNRLLFYP